MFKSATSWKSVELKEGNSGNIMIKHIPPQVINIEQAIAIMDFALTAEHIINYLSGGNLLIFFFRGIAMQKLKADVYAKSSRTSMKYRKQCVKLSWRT